MLRVNESLFWVNAARVKERVLEIAADHPDTKALILDLESTDQLEITSSDMLAMLLERLRSRGIALYLVRVRFHVRTVLGNTGMRASLGEDHLWHSISQGVRAARAAHGLKAPKPDLTPLPVRQEVTTAPSEDDLPIEPEFVLSRSMDLRPEDLAGEPPNSIPGVGRPGP